MNKENKKFAVVEKIFEYKGHECVVVFNRLGFRCGYVSVKEYKDYDEWDIHCHCGLTFNGKLPYDYGQKEKYFIGFDCGHICDGIDKIQAYNYGLVDEKMLEYMWDTGEPVRNLEYVTEQCKKIVDQLEDNNGL